MNDTQDRGRLDWLDSLVELAGASAPALAAAFAAARIAPVNGWTTPIAVLIAGGGVFGAAYLAMRVVPAEARHLELRHFHALVLEDELLLDQAVEVDELLLDDPLPPTANDSRVVKLFADGRMPSAGQLRDRIDLHLSDVGKRVPAGDASDALSEALAELRRSLRQA